MDLSPALIFLLFAMPTVPISSDWGAEVLNNTDRPKDAWRNNFNNVVPILVQGNFYDALNQCPINNYCVLAIDQLELNTTIYLNRSKTKIIGLPNNQVTFPNNSNISDYTYFIVENNTFEVIIEGLNIDGKSEVKKISNGLLIYGRSISNVIFNNNNIHHLHTDDDKNARAHGIAVLGTGDAESTAISQVIIENNQVHDMKTGSSENIAVNGNVKNWEIKNNIISHVNNIAIDAIGGEGTVPAITLENGRVVPSAFDSARYGFIENNTVLNMSTVTNAAYNNEIRWAGAIYVDGAHHIVVANNSVRNTPWSYVVGAENCIISNNITMTNNTAQESWYGDALFGGYERIGYLTDLNINCNPATSSDDGEGHGYVENITVTGNSFLDTSNNPSPNTENITLQFRLRNSIINQTGVQAINIEGNVSGDENSIRTK